MKAHLLFLFLTILFASAIHAQIVLLDGAVSKYPILMAIDTSDSKVANGVYFYKKTKQDIDLTGSISKNGSIELSSDDTGDKFSMTRKGNIFQGTFTNAKGVKLPVSLKLIKDTLNKPEGKKNIDASDVLASYKFADIKLLPGKLETIGNKFVIQWYTEATSEINTFKIIKGYPEEIMQKSKRNNSGRFRRQYIILFFLYRI